MRNLGGFGVIIMAQFIKADRLADVELSDIVRMSRAAREARGAGRFIIDLGIGEPDFNTPDHANEAAIAAIRAHDTQYPPIAGKMPLREAVAGLYAGRSADNVIITSGSKYALLNAMLASLNQGDEVICLAPFWVSYAHIIRLCGGVPIVVPCRADADFRPDLDAIADAMTPRTRWLIVNSPSNPSGAVLTADDLRGIGGLIAAHQQCWLLSDEIYEHITYEQDFASAAAVLPELADRTLIVSGVSKSYAMTGWRVGYGVAPAPLIEAMTTAQAQGTAGTSTPAQAAALAALTGEQNLLADRREQFRHRRDLVLEHIAKMDGITTSKPMGAFYVFPSWQARMGWQTPDGKVLKNDMDFCQYMLAAGVAVIPGSAFGTAGHFRISYAADPQEIKQAMQLMAGAVADLREIQ